VREFGAEGFALAFARIECHYFMNRGFFHEDGQLIAEAHRLKHIPGVIIQGRYDVVTPPATAWDLHKAWPEADFIMVADAGHTATEPGIASALVQATDRFRYAKTHSSGRSAAAGLLQSVHNCASNEPRQDFFF
jgi:proline iminopeptidase